MLKLSATVIGRALSWGAVYWGFYAAVDYGLSEALPPLLRPAQYVPDASYWNAGVTALIAMIAGGAIVGAATGLFWNAVASRRPSGTADANLAAGACVSVIAVFAGVVGAKTSRGVLPLVLTLALPLTLAAVVLWASLSESRAPRFWYLTNPITITLALLVRPWLYRDILRDAPQRWQTIASASALLLIVGCSWVLGRIGRHKRVSVEGWSSLRWIRNVALLLGLLSVVGGFVIRSGQRLIGAGDAPNAAGKPNIILIVMDTVRADHTSLYGYGRDTTPNLRRLAADSTLYRNAISAASWTAPSHASIFTGMYTLRHGVRYNLPNNALGRLPDAVPTLTEVLAHQGYRTAGRVANQGYLSDSLGFGRGFDSYRLAVPWMLFEQSRYPSILRSVRRGLLPPADKDSRFVNGGRITAEALRILSQLAGRQPFFLFLNYMDAHWPYTPPEPFRSRFGASSRNMSSDDYAELVRAVDSRERTITDAEQRDLIAAYDGGIAYLDQQLGILLDALRRAGVYENALIIVTSDHGEAFGEKSVMEHGTSVYQNQVHVPLLIKFPGQREPAEQNALVSGVDLYPTVMEAVGAPVGRYLAGVALQRASGRQSRAVFAELYPEWDMWTTFPRFHRLQRAMFRDSWKFILSSEGDRELYDLSTDAGENRNLMGEQPEVAAQMEGLLSAWQRNLTPVNGPPGIDKDTLDRLKSLGYVH
jgi:arylsulfatase A-like enzyme